VAIFLSITLFIVGLILLWQVQRRRKAIGLPAGRVIYNDIDRWGSSELPLYDPELGITGKPDYLVVDGNQIIPVEVKSGRITNAPYDAHIFQLAAYCFLAHRHFNQKPAYGILHYPNRTFAIDYTPELQAALVDLLEQMRSQDKRRELQRSHDSVARCNRCGFRTRCNQRLM
jgi:CRISPR-associated exonuclease Cas4